MVVMFTTLATIDQILLISVRDLFVMTVPMRKISTKIRHLSGNKKGKNLVFIYALHKH